MKLKYTPWFDPVMQPPIRAGWYPVIFEPECAEGFLCWNNGLWSASLDDIFEPFIELWGERPEGFKWRGLTAPHPDYKGE